MVKYILLSTLTERGRATLKKNPERIKEVNEELKNMGVKVLKQGFNVDPILQKQADCVSTFKGAPGVRLTIN